MKAIKPDDDQRMLWDRRDFSWGEPTGDGNWERSFRPLLTPEVGRETGAEEWGCRAGEFIGTFVKPGRFLECGERSDPLPASGAGIA